jgi:hypothetical protein
VWRVVKAIDHEEVDHLVAPICRRRVWRLDFDFLLIDRDFDTMRFVGTGLICSLVESTFDGLAEDGCWHIIFLFCLSRGPTSLNFVMMSTHDRVHLITKTLEAPSFRISPFLAAVFRAGRFARVATEVDFCCFAMLMALQNASPIVASRHPTLSETHRVAGVVRQVLFTYFDQPQPPLLPQELHTTRMLRQRQ